MQPEKLSPKQFSLSLRTVLELVDDHTIAIVINRKNRIIMADGKKILEKATKIKEAAPINICSAENHSTSLQQNESVSFDGRD